MTRIMRLPVTILLAFGLVAGCATHSPNEPVARPAPNPAPRTPDIPLPPMPEAGYTWQDLVQHVIAANPDHAAILADARAEYFRYKSRTGPQDPRLTFDYTNRDFDRYSGNLRFYIPNPFVDKHVLRTGEAAQREIAATADALKHEIAQAVYALVQEILSDTRTLSVLAARERVLTDWAAHLKERQAARVATQADVLALDLQRLRLKAAIQQKHLATQTARRTLHVLTRIPAGQLTLDPQPTDWQALQATLADEQQLVEDTFACSAELAAARAAHDKARAMLDTAKARQLPWFAHIQAGFGTRDDDSTSSRNDADEWRLRLAVNIPLFTWMSTEKKMAAAAMEAAAFREDSIRQRIRNEITAALTDLRETLDLQGDYQAALAAIPEPTRETTPDAETFFKLSDTRLSATEYALQNEYRCALIYGQLLNALGGLTQMTHER